MQWIDEKRIDYFLGEATQLMSPSLTPPPLHPSPSSTPTPSRSPTPYHALENPPRLLSSGDLISNIYITYVFHSSTFFFIWTNLHFRFVSSPNPRSWSKSTEPPARICKWTNNSWICEFSRLASACEMRNRFILMFAFWCFHKRGDER